jgi:hypothetical protein
MMISLDRSKFFGEFMSKFWFGKKRKDSYVSDPLKLILFGWLEKKKTHKKRGPAQPLLTMIFEESSTVSKQMKPKKKHRKATHRNILQH